MVAERREFIHDNLEAFIDSLKTLVDRYKPGFCSLKAGIHPILQPIEPVMQPVVGAERDREVHEHDQGWDGNRDEELQVPHLFYFT